MLLCDDDESIVSAHMRVLNEQGVRKVDKASDGLEVLKMFLDGELTKYELILLDYSMGFMDGTDAVKVMRFMKEKGIGERCGFNYEVMKRIVFASGAVEVVREVMGDKRGEFKYYNKPVCKRDLRKILKDCGVLK